MATTTIKVPVVNLEQTANLIVVSSWDKIYVLSMATLALVYCDEVCANSKGIFAVSS